MKKYSYIATGFDGKSFQTGFVEAMTDEDAEKQLRAKFPTPPGTKYCIETIFNTRYHYQSWQLKYRS